MDRLSRSALTLRLSGKLYVFALGTGGFGAYGMKIILTIG